nr:uncharacterized mitochondrial protein AtMg00810-like [Tanacetum cinerariifolium]
MSYLTDYVEINGGYVAFKGNSKGEKITGRGTIKTGKLDFENVYFVRELKFNLFSVSQMCDKKNSVFFNDTECIVLSPNFKLTDESLVLLKVPRKNYMYSVDLKNIIHKGDLTCLFAKAISDESKLWHRRLGHLNFKTMNKLVKGNLVSGLPSKILENNQDCVACQKRKQHRASCKFNGKADKGFFVGYSLNSEAFGVFNSRTRIVEENLHIRFSENTLNIARSRPNWLFDIDTLTKSMNYKPVIARNQSNSNAGTEACDDAGSQNDGFQPSSDDGKKIDEDPRQEIKCKDQKKEDNVNIINNVNAAGTNRVTDVGTNTNNALPFDLEIPKLEDISTFTFSNKDEDDGVEADMNNLDTTIQVSPTSTTRIHKDHPIDQVIGDLHSTTQTWNMTKNLEKHGFVTTIHQRTDHKDLQNYLFSCFLSQEEPKRMDVQSAFLYGKIKEEDLCNAFEKMMYKKFQMSSMGELTFFLGFQVKQKLVRIFISQDKYVAEILKKYGFLEVKNARTPMETQKPLLKDEDGEEVDVHMYRLMIGSLMYLTSSRPDIIFAVCACARYQVNPKVSHLYVVKRIFRYLKGHPKLGLWYPKDSPFDLVAYTDSDYARASLDRKSTIGGTSSGGGPRCQEAIGDIVAQTRYEKVSKVSNDPLLVGVNIPQSGEDSMKLTELMELGTNLQNRVLDLETTKTTQEMEIESLKRRVKKLKKRQKSRTHKLKRLYKVGLSTRVKSYTDEGLGKEDASKQRRIVDIDANKDIYLLFVSQEVNVATVTTTTATIDDITLAQALAELKSAKPKVKDKGKGKMVEQEPVKKFSKKDQLMLDDELAFKLQAKEEENMIAREKAQQIKEVNIAWDDKRIKFFATKRAEKKRNRPPTKAQQRSIMSTYLKKMDGWKLISLKKKSFAEFQELFDKAMKKVNTFVDFKTELVEKKSKQAEAEITQKDSLKRGGDDLEQEKSKKQKVKDDKESEELNKCLEIILDDEDEVTIDATPLSFMSPTIVDYKIYQEGKKSYFQIFRADDRFKKVKPVNHMDSFLLHNLKTMFEHHVEDNVRKNQQGLAKVKNWKLYDSFRVHCVIKQNILYYLLVEKMYPLTNHTLHQMFNDVKLQVDYECKMAYKLLRLVKKQLKEGYVHQ